MTISRAALQRIYQVLQYNPQATYAELGALTGNAKTTAGKAVRELIRLGYVHENVRVAGQYRRFTRTVLVQPEVAFPEMQRQGDEIEIIRLKQALAHEQQAYRQLAHTVRQLIRDIDRHMVIDRLRFGRVNAFCAEWQQ